MDSNKLIEELQGLKEPSQFEDSKRRVWAKIQSNDGAPSMWLSFAAVCAASALAFAINYRLTPTPRVLTFADNEYSLEIYSALLTGVVEPQDALEILDGSYSESDTDERSSNDDSDLIADAQSLDQLTEDYAELLFGVSSQTLTEN